ncbi:Brp/Blh family beta-carotene 15,15'-dioxygenase [Kineococcus sp. SYSU DK018]|uniref:Brp/Blh family beta-carotene 15,15'-dioxygenase n=1 Tax=Kineococcus sp. SYSU DK018 TaxID=3383139 RepID=UPI003D7C7153
MTSAAEHGRLARPAGPHHPVHHRAPCRTGRSVRGPEAAATVLSLAVLGTVLLVQLGAPQVWREHGWVVLVAGLLAGLPHGAVDHLVPTFVLRERAPRVLLVATGYAATAAAAWLLFRTFPAAALVAFVLVSVLHFGSGEVAFDDERAGRAVGTGRDRDVLAVVATGGAVLVLPVVGDAASVAPITALVVPGSSGVLPWWLTTGATVLVLSAVVLTVARRLHRRRRLAAAEVALLAAVGLLVPPLVAFGAYFGGWHAVRHVGRLLAEDPANTGDLAAGRLARPLGRFALAAAAPTAVSLAALGALWSTTDGWRGFVTADLAVLAGLTVPHVLVVAWWDRHPRARSAPPGAHR